MSFPTPRFGWANGNERQFENTSLLAPKTIHAYMLNTRQLFNPILCPIFFTILIFSSRKKKNEWTSLRTILAHMCVCNRKIYWPYFQYVGSKWTFWALHAHWWSSVICDLFRGGRWMVPLRTFCWIWNNGKLLFELLFCHACTCTEDVKLWKLWDII